MLILGSGRFRPHAPWAIAVIAASLGAAVWYTVASGRHGELLGGSSLPGLVFGVVAAGLILFEMALWPRKRMRARRYLGRAQTWMRAHICLGLLTVPLVLLHSGFRLGSPLTTVLSLVFFVVIASGVWGLMMQHWLPAKMSNDVPLETIYNQIDNVGEQMSNEAKLLVMRLCGETSAVMDESLASSASFLVLGAPSVSSGSIAGRSLHSITSMNDIAEGELLVNFYLEELDPYLTRGRRSRSPLSDAGYARRCFEQLRGRLEPMAHPVVDRLAALCEERRQLDKQKAMHTWLHNWLLVHLPLSVALVILLALHIWVAMKYW